MREDFFDAQPTVTMAFVNTDHLPEVHPMSQPNSQDTAMRSGTFPTPALTQPGSSRQTLTATMLGENGVSQTSISIQDDRPELFAVLYDQIGVQKVIDRLNAVKGMLPENPIQEAAN